MNADVTTGEVAARSPLERHTQTILGVVATALLLWVGSTISDNSETLGRFDERMKGMESQLKDVKNTVSLSNIDRYTGTDAREDKEQLMYMFGQLEKRVEKLENTRGN